MSLIVTELQKIGATMDTEDTEMHKLLEILSPLLANSSYCMIERLKMFERI
jgi:hypothetical protein